MKEIELTADDGSMEAQLLDLYRGQRLLLSRLGTADPVEIVAMVNGLREQLVALYAERDSTSGELPVYRGEKDS